MIHGNAGLGKTLAAMSIAACVAQLYVPERGSAPHFHKASQVEQLPRDGLATCVLVILDELSPNLTRGHSPKHTVDELRIILDAENGGGITGKGASGKSIGVIEFAAGQPRAIASNGRDPHELMEELPRSLLSVSPAAVAALSPNARAIIKRLRFYHATSNILSAEAVSNHHMVAVQSAAERFDRIFAGASAIP